MGGKGLPPKDDSKRIRRNIPTIPTTVVEVESSGQPALTDLFGETNPLTKMLWSQPALLLWDQLRDFPTTKNLLPAQWSSLGRALMLDDALLAGHVSLAGEVRLRFAKYGIDPDDLARARVKVVAPDAPKTESQPLSNTRRANILKLVGGTNESSAV